jgi:DNA-binding CsgD family transcriptional regulator
MALFAGDRVVWRAASDIAEAVNGAERGGQLGQLVMHAVDRMVGCDLGSILTASPGEDWAVAGEIADNAPLAASFWRYTREMDPDEVTRMTGRFVSAEEVFEPRRRMTLAVFSEFLVPRGLRGLLVRNWVVDGRVYALGITRRSPSFTELERQRLLALFPHVKAALRVDASLSESRAESPAVSDGGAWGLTPAQDRTMALAVRGLTNKEIASLLGCALNTVRNTLVEVFKKVGVSRRSELAFIVRGGSRSELVSGEALAWQRRFVAKVESNDERFASPRTRR